MHFFGAIAVSEITTLRGENIMKKLVTILAALAFALGLTVSGYTQTTTVKEGDKPAVKTQAPAATSQAAPVEKDKAKAKEATKPATKEATKAATKEADKPVSKESDHPKGKKPENLVSKKDNGKKPAAPAPETKKEATKDATK